MIRQMWFPYKPATVAQAINRRLAATGSPRLAQLSEGAEYNGHYVRIYFNDHRGYWLAEYTWAGRCVIMRGSFEECARAAAEFHRTQGAGGAVSTDELTEDQAAFCASLGMVPYSKEIESATYEAQQTWAHKEVTTAIWLMEKLGVHAAPSILVTSKTKEEYDARIQAVRPKVLEGILS